MTVRKPSALSTSFVSWKRVLLLLFSLSLLANSDTDHYLFPLLAEYAGGAGELSEWIKARIDYNNTRNFPKTSEDCLKLAGEEQNFKKTDKVKKGEFKDNLVADHVLIAAKIRKENHPDFKLSDETTPAGLGNLWAQLEKAESERASALAAEQIRLGGQGKAKNKTTTNTYFLPFSCD